MRNLHNFEGYVAESGDQMHWSALTRSQLLSRVRAPRPKGYGYGIHPSILSNVLSWRSIHKSPASGSLYSEYHDVSKLSELGWMDKTMRMSNHWNMHKDIPMQRFLSNLSSYRDDIVTYFELVFPHRDPLRMDLALQKSLYDRTTDPDEPYKTNEEKIDMVRQAAERGVAFDAAVIWHNARWSGCGIAIVGPEGISVEKDWVDHAYVRQTTQKTNTTVRNDTHWTVARYSKSRNLWIVQDSKPEGDYRVEVERRFG